MIGGLQGENGDLDIKYLKQNKFKKVSRKYLEALRRISQACKMVAKFHNHHLVISQPKVDFAACEIGLQFGVIGFQWL